MAASVIKSIFDYLCVHLLAVISNKLQFNFTSQWKYFHSVLYRIPFINSRLRTLTNIEMPIISISFATWPQSNFYFGYGPKMLLAASGWVHPKATSNELDFIWPICRNRLLSMKYACNHFTSRLQKPIYVIYCWYSFDILLSLSRSLALFIHGVFDHFHKNHDASLIFLHA